MNEPTTPCPNCAAATARVVDVERENAELRRRLLERRGGRPPARAGDEKTQLVENVCRSYGLSRKGLAELLGIRHQSRLSPTGRFAEREREQIMAKLREMASNARPLAKKRSKA
jgi:hypothetical protein